MNTSDLTSVGYRVHSLEEIREKAPAAFTSSPHPDRTDRYSFFSTSDFIDTMGKMGWDPYSVKQNGKSLYGRHIIRFNNQSMGAIPVNGDIIRPQLMLDNSHDGFSKGKLHLGLFRLVCSNGLVVGIPGMHTAMNFLHMNIDTTEIMKVIAEISEQYRIVGSRIEEMQDVILNDDQMEEFAMKALALREPTRFIAKDGSPLIDEITKAINPKDLIRPVRPQDEKENLWTIFNVLQERTVKGLYERKSASGRSASPRVITNATRHLEYNKKLWTVAEEYMPENSSLILS